jgi:tetratricopeptide (TPR) repeat protein
LGQQYNRKLADVFAVQEEIAKEISDRLRLKLTGAERQQLAKRPTENIKAFQYYMQGRSYAQRRTREDLLEAVRYCEKALEEDPNYALAYAGLSEAYQGLGVRGYIAPIEGRRRMEEAARKALALDDNLAEAHLAFGPAYVAFAPSNFSFGDRSATLKKKLSLKQKRASTSPRLPNLNAPALREKLLMSPAGAFTAQTKFLNNILSAPCGY